MYLIIILVLIPVAIWFGLVYIRKTMWDAVHRNLLDLEDHYEGRVIRRSFAARPVFYGRVNGVELTINFSSERSVARRMSYIDISLAKSMPFSMTISRKSWLDEQQAAKQDNGHPLENDYGEQYVLLPVETDRLETILAMPELIPLLNEFRSLAYLFIGTSGILCELVTDAVINDTQFDILDRRLRLLDSFGESLRNE